MLRSLGSSLVAKSSPGGKLREIGEQAITTPQIPGKGAIGTISRAGIEEPLKREVPAGSEKIVGTLPVISSQPGLPSDVIPSEVMPPAPIPEGMSPSVSASVPQGNRGQALFQGGVGGATAGAPRPATQQVSKGAPYVGWQPPVEDQGQESTPTSGGSTPRSSVQNQPSMASVPYRAPDVRSLPSFAGKVIAGDRPTPTPAPKRMPTPAITPAPQRAASAPRSNPVQNIVNQLRSVVQNLFSRLRSSW